MTAPDAPFRFTQEENVSILVLQQELNNVQWGEIDSIGTQVLNALADRTHPNVIIQWFGSARAALRGEGQTRSNGYALTPSSQY